MAREYFAGIAIFVAGLVLFIIGVVLVSDLILKFLRFFIGVLLILIGLPMMLGSFKVRRLFRGRVVRVRR